VPAVNGADSGVNDANFEGENGVKRREWTKDLKMKNQGLIEISWLVGESGEFL
jgi:hypothetical protein